MVLSWLDGHVLGAEQLSGDGLFELGKMLAALGRHPNRPAHMHFLVTAPGFQKLVTHTFVGDDPWITSDAVFGVKATLVGPDGMLAAPDGVDGGRFSASMVF